MSAVFESEPSEIEKLMNKFPKSKFKLEKKHVANINQINDFILTEFECEICKNIPVDPIECDRCS
jgi:predicted polyphosphate/ATP-dependent NAD kinase